MEKEYSDWLKIDLHIHTDLSKYTKEDDYKGSFSIVTAKSKLKENNVKIFSLTDHNIINEAAYQEYYETYTEEDPFLLLGVELDIVVVRNLKQKTYHTLLIFNCIDIETIKSISSKLEKKYADKGITDLKKRQLTIEEIVELFPEQNYFFIPHAYSDKNIVTAYKDGAIEKAQKMVLLMQCALEKVTKEETIAVYNNGFNTLLSSSFKSQNDIPYINFSDNHCINNYPCRHKGENNIGNHEFYYIKGSKSYESIRLAFIDPESRIKTTSEFNEINHTNNTIDFFKIENEPLISNTSIEFSPHLNVIIGGRSSGKSLLMWMLGKKIDSLDIENKYSKYDINCATIKSKNDADFKVSTSLQHNYIYVKQGDIVNYFEAGQLRDLAKKSNKDQEYIRALSEFTNQKQQLELLKSNFISEYRNIFDLGYTKKFILHNTTIESILSSHYILKFDENELNQKFNKSQVLRETEILLENTLGNIETIFKSEILDISTEDALVINSFKQLIQEKSLLLKLMKERDSKRTSFIQTISTIIIEVNSSLNIEARLKEQSNTTLSSLINDISNRFIKLKELKEKSASFESFECSFKQCISIDESINLILETPNEHNIKSEILDGINNSESWSSLYKNSLRLLMQNSSLKRLPDNTPENFSKKINTQLNSSFSDFSNPKDYLEYEDGETSKEKSPGYNSEKYLEIILKNPHTKTIFIDQPEDNLGNKFIAEGLVRIIRDIKFKKQIFLVTHNPSVVVYGDAESIILAKNNDNLITYEQIVLENRNAQKEICSILDGGEYIFNNRSKKYNIQRILKEA